MAEQAEVLMETPGAFSALGDSEAVAEFIAATKEMARIEIEQRKAREKIKRRLVLALAIAGTVLIYGVVGRESVVAAIAAVGSLVSCEVYMFFAARMRDRRADDEVLKILAVMGEQNSEKAAVFSRLLQRPSPGGSRASGSGCPTQG
ncbi:hypothetical protein [Streptomyces sp. 5-10]|uniref:hypothetical protein n=1 Tax=Streptomyces sp. 5-10 TaxID=878925 RepID=UPI00168B678B|nr:hypothetical protein [Streptomyces sp. 5-10]MBD3007094.1 hypothetical protein [Streptomyces sp. 5-10]